MDVRIGIEVSEDLKDEIFSHCGTYKVSGHTQELLHLFACGMVDIPFEPIPPANKCNSRLDLIINIDVLNEAKKMNKTSLQRTNRWLITRLWKMRLNGEI